MSVRVNVYSLAAWSNQLRISSGPPGLGPRECAPVCLIERARRQPEPPPRCPKTRAPNNGLGVPQYAGSVAIASTTSRLARSAIVWVGLARPAHASEGVLARFF